jgi:hypothetical protein
MTLLVNTKKKKKKEKKRKKKKEKTIIFQTLYIPFCTFFHLGLLEFFSAFSLKSTEKA